MNRILVRTLSVTLFLSAFLLFWCQPMIGKMVLPHLGGAGAVWTTCVLFFQAVLLIGYVYAHLLARIPSVRFQIAVHVCVLLTPLAFLPLTFATGIGEAAFEHPALALLRSLAITVGIPFFVVSTTAPLLQNWLARTDETIGKDPYFLYAASNAGSLLALLLYPFAVEPRIGVNAQSSIWSTGYGFLIALIAITAGMVWRNAGKVSRSHKPMESEPRPPLKTRLFWILNAFIASGLMLAVTNHITSDLAAAPFLWILPLAIYLLTFIVAFSPRLKVGSERISRVSAIVLLFLFPAVVADVVIPAGLNWALIVLHLVLLYVGALLCHARMAESRPHSTYLTEFYFWVALGGVLGGVFTATLS